MYGVSEMGVCDGGVGNVVEVEVWGDGGKFLWVGGGG